MLGTCTLNLARSASLREAADVGREFHVLRTNRRTRSEEGKAQENAKAWLLLE